MNGKKMMAARLHKVKSPLLIEEIAMPSPGPGEALVEIKACGICGTDVCGPARGSLRLSSEDCYRRYSYDPSAGKTPTEIRTCPQCRTPIENPFAERCPRCLTMVPVFDPGCVSCVHNAGCPVASLKSHEENDRRR